MSRCKHCRGSGLVFIRYTTEPNYDLAACTCQAGQRWRAKFQLRAQAALLVPPPTRIGRLEEFFTEAELATLATRFEMHDPSQAVPA